MRLARERIAPIMWHAALDLVVLALTAFVLWRLQRLSRKAAVLESRFKRLTSDYEELRRSLKSVSAASI